MMTAPKPTATHDLNALDRCDRCGAQAFVLTRQGGLDLMWCVHHFREHGAALAEAGAVVVTDERKRVE